jgi:hypothetical protein
MSNLTEVTLETLQGGAALELFQREWDRAIANLVDPNTLAKAKRTVTLKVTILPEEDRESGDIVLEVGSKLAGTRPVKSRIWVGEKDGRPVGAEFNPNQPDFFESQDPQIRPLPKEPIHAQR